jgi:hypothetical protein
MCLSPASSLIATIIFRWYDARVIGYRFKTPLIAPMDEIVPYLRPKLRICRQALGSTQANETGSRYRAVPANKRKTRPVSVSLCIAEHPIPIPV